MKKHLGNNKGNAMVELIMVMVLIILFSITICTLIFSGTSVQELITENKDQQIDARIALSTLNVRLRQNDESGSITIETNPITGLDSLKVTQHDIENYDLWIFFVPGENGENGTLYEFLGYEGEEPSLDLSTALISVRDFTIKYNETNNSVTNTVYYDYNGEVKEMSSTLAIRSSLEGGGAEIVILE